MKLFLRIVGLMLAINACIAAEGEAVSIFDPYGIEHPVFTSGNDESVLFLQENDPHLGPVHQSSLFHNSATGKPHAVSQFSGAFRLSQSADLATLKLGRVPYQNRDAIPVSIGMKLLFPEHYFW